MGGMHTATITDLLGDDRWAEQRIAGLDRGSRQLYALILYRFTQGGPPHSRDLGRLGFHEDALSQLLSRDLVALGDDGQVAVAYPFSAVPTRHRAVAEDGQVYWAMCAIDALGMPYLLRQAAEIHAREPDSDQSITIAIGPVVDTPNAGPTEAVVVARSGDGCAAGCPCPHTNLFASAAAAERYLATSELHGSILDLPAATTAGRRLFGDLLDRLGAGPPQ
jgi:Alkylmercury lyase